MCFAVVVFFYTIRCTWGFFCRLSSSYFWPHPTLIHTRYLSESHVLFAASFLWKLTCTSSFHQQFLFSFLWPWGHTKHLVVSRHYLHRPTGARSPLSVSTIWSSPLSLLTSSLLVPIVNRDTWTQCCLRFTLPWHRITISCYSELAFPAPDLIYLCAPPSTLVYVPPIYMGGKYVDPFSLSSLNKINTNLPFCITLWCYWHTKYLPIRVFTIFTLTRSSCHNTPVSICPLCSTTSHFWLYRPASC